MRNLFARWMNLRTDDRWRLLGLMVALPTVAALLRLFGMVRTRRWLERISETALPRPVTAEELESAERLTALADIAGRRGAITATCLRQALVVYWLLRRRGLTPEFMIGVRKQEQAFDAHAWVQLQGVALGQINLAHTPFTDRDWTTTAVR